MPARRHSAHSPRAQSRPGAVRKAQHSSCIRRASAVIAHSPAAKERIASEFRTPRQRIHVIPHGDLSVVLPLPVPQVEARSRLDLPAGPLCLISGAVEPYKGIEEIVAVWRKERPEITLVIAGKPITDAYRSELEAAAVGIPKIALRFAWLDDEQLGLWLSAADVVLFNYREIFTSGAACLARSRGIPILLPARLHTVDLDEPHRAVVRFESPGSDLLTKLQTLLYTPSSYEAAAPWREATAWPRIAKLTAATYRPAR